MSVAETAAGESLAGIPLANSPGAALARLAGAVRRAATLASSIAVSVAVFGLFAIQGVFLARCLGPTARGEFATIMVWPQTLTHLGLLGIALAVARAAAPYRISRQGFRNSRDVRRHGEGRLASGALRSGLYTGGGCMFVAIVLSVFALPSEKAYLTPLCLVAAVFLPLEHMRLGLLAVDHGAARFHRYNACRVIAAAAFPILLLLLWLSGVITLAWVAFAAVAAPGLGLAWLLASRRGDALGRRPRPGPLSIIRRGRPFAAANFAAELFGRLDVMLMLWFADLTTQGYYAAAVPAASALLVAPHTLALFSFNAGADRANTYTLRRLWLLGSGLALLQVIAAAAFCLLLPFLITLVYGEEFRPAIWPAVMLTIANAMNGWAYVAEGFLQGRGLAMAGVRGRLASCAALLLAAFAGYPVFGWQAIPLAAAAGALVSCLWMGASVALLAASTDSVNRKGGV